MSRTIKGSKSPHFEYWSKREGNRKGNLYGVGRKTKKITLGCERLKAKDSIRKDIIMMF